MHIRHASLLLSGLLFAAVGCLSQANAQQAGTANSKPVQQPASNWATNCSSTARNEPVACSIEQRIILRETGRQLARISIQIGSGEPRQAALLIHVPLGLSLRTGIKMQVDDGDATKLDIQTCDAAGCYAGSPVSSQLVSRLKQGNVLKIYFQNLQQKEISVSFSLVGFTMAYSRVE